MAKVRLTGILKGTLPVTMRHKQSMPPLVRDLRALQHSVVGEVPLAHFMKFKLSSDPHLVILSFFLISH